MADLVVIAVLLTPIVAVIAVMRNRRLQSELRSATIELEVDELGVRRELADGRVEWVYWGEVQQVSVLVTNRGPHASSGGVVILWGDETRGCLVPIDRAKEAGLYEHLARLPRFDLGKLAVALDQRPVRQTLVWSAPGAGDADSEPW